MKTEITQIKIKLEGRDIDLTSTEAKQLRDELNALFGKPEKRTMTEEVMELSKKLREDIGKDLKDTRNPIMWPYNPYPTLIEPKTAPWRPPYEVTCIGKPTLNGIYRQGGEATISLRS